MKCGTWIRDTKTNNLLVWALAKEWIRLFNNVILIPAGIGNEYLHKQINMLFGYVSILSVIKTFEVGYNNKIYTTNGNFKNMPNE